MRSGNRRKKRSAVRLFDRSAEPGLPNSRTLLGFAVLYFAYGSNMDPRHMQRRCPGCALVAAALLRDHRLAFTRLWESGGGMAGIVPAPGNTVEGVVWEITGAHREALDEYEEYPTAYSRADVVVETLDGRRLTAFAYIARPGARSHPPGARYLRQLVEGARAHGLSAAYVASLEAIATED